MPFDKSKQLFDLVRPGFSFHLLEVHKFADVLLMSEDVVTPAYPR